ncbi:MAG: hypothetical protein ABIL09_10680 [Gemmatimonadota bacterium]
MAPGTRQPQDAVSVLEPDSTSAAALTDYLVGRAASGGSESSRLWVAVLPFGNESGFRRGVWDLEQEVPRMLTSVLTGQVPWGVVPFEAVVAASGGKAPQRPVELQRLGSTLRADILIQGTLLDLDMERLHVGDPLLAGYKSYRGVAELEITALRVVDGSAAGSAHSRQEILERGLGLDLLGKPREQDYQFANLDRLRFGSDEFRKTALGQAVVAAMDEVAVELTRSMRPGGLEVTGEPPQVLSVYGEEIFINLGSENGVHRGYRFAVLPAPGSSRREGAEDGAPVGVVEVQDVIGARVSRVRALGSQAQIAPGDGLQLITEDDGDPAATKEEVVR